MIHAPSLFLSLALFVQGGPTHADLHPPEADIYVELGDVGVLLTALDKAPMTRFLRDERLKPLFAEPLVAEFGKSADRSLKELVKWGLSSALPDSQPDTWLDGLKTISVSMVALGPGTDTTAPMAFLAIADLATPEQAKALHALVIARAPKHEPMTSALAGAERLHLSDKTAEDLWCAAIGARVVVGGSATKPEDFVARADKKGAGLMSRESLQKQLAALDKASGTPVLWFALARPLTDVLATMQNEDMDFLKKIPSEFNPLASPRVARMQLVGERFVTEMISTEAVSEAKPVDAAWLEPVPAGSMIVYSSAFDGAAAGKKMRELLAKDEQSAASLAALEQKLGYGPERALARLGPGLTVFAAPPAGMGLPETRVWIDCDDPAAFTAEFEALVGALGETLPGFVAKTKPYKVKKGDSEEKIEIPVTTLTLPQGMVQIPMISVAPSFAPVGKKLVFGIGSMDVKNELKRVHGGGDDGIVPGANALAASGFQMPAGTRSVFVMDWAKLLGSVVGMAKAMAGLVPPDQMPFDLAKLPPSEMFAEFFKPTFHFSKSIPGGLYRRNEASFGPETWLGLMGAGAAATNSQRQASAAAAEAERQALEVPVPAPESAGGGQ